VHGRLLYVLIPVEAAFAFGVALHLRFGLLHLQKLVLPLLVELSLLPLGHRVVLVVVETREGVFVEEGALEMELAAKVRVTLPIC
jgi:hypothetical protein